MSTFIYDPDTGNYFDPISGVYYDPNTQVRMCASGCLLLSNKTGGNNTSNTSFQREIPMGREASSSPPPPSSGRRRKSQERLNERDDTPSRDNRERKERHRTKSAKVNLSLIRLFL